MIGKDKLNHEKMILLLLFLSGLVFILFLIVTARNVRPCSDDLFFYSEFKTYGWFDSIWNLETNIRITGFYIFNSICFFASDFLDLPRVYFIYFLLLFCFLLFAINYFLLNFLSYFNNEKKVNFLLLFPTSFLFLVTLYFSTINAQEVWFWTIATSIYLLPVPLILLALSEYFKDNTAISFIKVAVLFTIIGGGVENFVLSLFFSMLTIYLYQLVFKRKANKKIIFGALFLTILPSISFLHNGIHNRLILEKNKNLDGHFFNFSFLDFDSGFNVKRVLILLFFYFLVFFVGRAFKRIGIDISIKFKQIVSINFLLLLVTYICTFLPLSLIFGSLGPARASMPFTFLLNTSCLFWAFYFGNHFTFKTRIFIIPAVLSLIMMSKFVYMQFFITQSFSKAFDKRIAFIKSQKNLKSKFILVDPLPNSGVIPSMEASILEKKPNLTSYYLGRLNGLDKDVFLKN